MDSGTVLVLLSGMLKVASMLLAPIVLTAMAVGLMVSILQAATQIQESTLTFVPKVIVVVIVILALGHWMLSLWVTYATELFESITTI